jgi:hypothetical protein
MDFITRTMDSKPSSVTDSSEFFKFAHLAHAGLVPEAQASEAKGMAIRRRMWSAVVGDLVDHLIPNGGIGLLGRWTLCNSCRGTGNTRKSYTVWQACPDCCEGRCDVDVSKMHAK